MGLYIGIAAAAGVLGAVLFVVLRRVLPGRPPAVSPAPLPASSLLVAPAHAALEAAAASKPVEPATAPEPSAPAKPVEPAAPPAALDVAAPSELLATSLEAPGHADSEAPEDWSRPNPLILVNACAKTDPGKRRKHNEDSFLVLVEHRLFLVADGMGRSAAGEIASNLATETIGEAFRAGDLAAEAAPGLTREATRLREAVLRANQAVYRRSREVEAYEGMGTTVVALHFSKNKERLAIAHAGDSRCYRLRGGELTQLTDDHTLGNAGLAGANASMLARAVGIEDHLDPELRLERPMPEDLYLLCSDGLSRMAPDAQIQAILREERDLEKVAATLIEVANDAGGRDNVTVILVRVEEAWGDGGAGAREGLSDDVHPRDHPNYPRRDPARAHPPRRDDPPREHDDQRPCARLARRHGDHGRSRGPLRHPAARRVAARHQHCVRRRVGARAAAARAREARRMTLRTVLEAIEHAAAQAEPSRGYHFYEDEGQAEPFFSYAGAERASARHGGALQALGLRKGDRVAIVLPDNDDFIFTLLGAMRAGMVPVPIYPPLGLGYLGRYLENTQHIVAKSGARALITTPRIKRMLGTVEASCPALKRVVTIDLLRSAREELRPVKVDLDDVALLQFTSGSTSRPKGVVLTHANIAANVQAINHEGLGISKDDVGVSWLPLYHDMGLIGFVIAPLYDNIPVVILPPLAFLKRPAAWLRAVSRHHGTISYGPNFAYALAVKRIRPADAEGLDLSSWRVAGCGAEPIRPQTLEGFARTFASIGFSAKAFLPSYGMAESTLAVSFTRPGEGMRTDPILASALWEEGTAQPASPEHPEALRLVRCGRPFAGHQVEVFALDDEHSERPLPERVIGELRLRGPSLMRGYYDDPALTAEALAGGWLRTGDLGYLVDGEVVLCGRSKELIIVNGRNFYPQDLEWEASRVDAVRKGNVIAFGTPDPAGDRERVVVVFETTLPTPEERAACVAAVRKAIQEGVGLTVDDVVPVGAGVLPKTSSGKLQRLQTRRLYQESALEGRRSAREPDRVDFAKELLRSQLAYMAAHLRKG